MGGVSAGYKRIPDPYKDPLREIYSKYFQANWNQPGPMSPYGDGPSWNPLQQMAAQYMTGYLGSPAATGWNPASQAAFGMLTARPQQGYGGYGGGYIGGYGGAPFLGDFLHSLASGGSTNQSWIPPSRMAVDTSPFSNEDQAELARTAHLRPTSGYGLRPQVLGGGPQMWGV